MWVMTNEARWGIIDPEQFTRGRSTDPGGPYFEGWYDVRYEDGRVVSQNGERLRTTAIPGLRKDATTISYQPSPTAQAALRRVAQLMKDHDEAWERAKKTTEHPLRTRFYQAAEARVQGGLDVLAAVLSTDGLDIIGYGGFPSSDLARGYLEHWANQPTT
jgi:hypothetical protein